MTLEGDFAFGDEGRGNVLTGFTNGFAIAEDFGFWEAETECYNENWWTSTEPKELKSVSLKLRQIVKMVAYWSPTVACCVDKTSCEGCSEKITESISIVLH